MEQQVRIEASTVPLYRAVVFAILWGILVWPAAYFLFVRGAHRLRDVFDHIRAEPLLLLWMIFPTLALYLTIRAIRLGLGTLRYGPAVLTIHPATLGGNVDGVIRAPGLRLGDEQRIRLTLKCRMDQVRRDYTDSTASAGTRGSVTETDKRIAQSIVPRSVISDGGGAAMIPVRLPISMGGRETGTVQTPVRGRTEQISWWLFARAGPWHLWEAAFVIPVSKPADTPYE